MIDKRPYSATHGISFPLPSQTFQVVQTPVNATTTTNVVGQCVFLSGVKQTARNYEFTACTWGAFYQANGTRNTRTIIKDFSFSRCAFSKFIFGNSSFTNVRFTDCTFKECDFSDILFDNCAFSNCTFIACTGWKLDFSFTTIDPGSFLDGLVFPERNYSKHYAPLAKQDALKFLRTKRGVAAGLRISLDAVGEVELKNEAKRQYCALDRMYRVQRLFRRNETGADAGTASVSFASAKSALRDIAYIASEAAFSLFTRNGTSLTRPALIFSIVTFLVYPQILPLLRVSHNGHANQFVGASYPDRVAGSVELFLGFGYGSFAGEDTISRISLLLCTLLGVLWYIFLVPLLTERARQ